jgi:GT2 family glycosyltransferase
MAAAGHTMRRTAGVKPRSQEWPIAVRLIDIRDPVRRIEDVSSYPRTRVFVQDAGVLIGSTDIPNRWAAISETRLRQAIADGLAYAIMSRAVDKQLDPGRGTPLDAAMSVSIVIPTCNRPDDLRRCLSALQAQDGLRRVEIVVVDNRPGAGATGEVLREFPGVVAIEEHRPGLSYARNAGFAAATGDLLVAIDDDVTVPAGWLERLIAPFARPEVMAVTGQVLPAQLETESQCRFEAYGGLGKGYKRFEVDGSWFRSMRAAVPTWHLGATANAAFRASAFLDPAIGLLDEALGAGMPTGCSEDTYLFYRILKAGHTIVYEPSAWVWHRHRSDMAALKHQIHSYSKGHVAYHLTTLLRDRDPRALVRLGWSLPKVYLRRTYARLRSRSDYPVSLIVTELAGNLAGPWALWQARRRVRRLGKSAPYVAPEQRSAPVPGKPSSRHAVPLESPFTESPAS